MPHDSSGWLAISTEGFAAMNAARPPEHLIKELVQNALDSFAMDSFAVDPNAAESGDLQAGTIELRYGHHNGSFHVACRDDGCGIRDLEDLRVVYLTHKTDSHRKRGRFGRGFKEALCIAEEARVVSGGRSLAFLQENGRRISRLSEAGIPLAGTEVQMRMPWGPETAEQLDAYFAQFLVPESLALIVNGRRIQSRQVAHRIEASLSTEIYDATSQCWKKPVRRTAIALVRALPDETPTIYEMGIPVASVEWGVPFHVDVQQRVPMNPNRDAVSSGYPLKLHVACLPVLLEHMDEATLKQDWVGAAGRRCDEQVQRQIIQRAFGENIARSVPKMGARQFDEDARDLGVQIINTAQTSGGFRDMLKALVPSAKEVVHQQEQVQAEQARSQAFVPTMPLEEQDPRRRWFEQWGGREHVEHCLDFAVWFCQQLIDTCPIPQQQVHGQLTLNLGGGDRLYAHWSSDNQLTLALDQPCFWRDPLGAEALMVLIHEAAHAMNMHHGYDFRKEMERLAGVAASLMLRQSEEIRRRFPELAPR